MRTQTILLQPGWNAVFLEVNPADVGPAAVFANTPIDIVAAHYHRTSPAQSLTNLGVNPLRKGGWLVWYAAERDDAFLTTLYAIYGWQSYLIHSKAAFAWNVKGRVEIPEVRWQPDAYNLVGFSVDALAPPTFAEFFAGSPAHRHNRIYRLVQGQWRQVTDPDAETMRSGDAFWIYCQGASQYQGPLVVETTTRHGLLLGGEVESVTLRNRAGHPITTTVEHVVAGTHPVPISIVIRAIGDGLVPLRSIAVEQPVGAWRLPLPPLPPGGAIRVPLEARLAEMTRSLHNSLLKIIHRYGNGGLASRRCYPERAKRPSICALIRHFFRP